jgi:drug/metabolite transporter (DMT)-like permease
MEEADANRDVPGQRGERLGLFLVLLSTTAYGTLPILTKVAYGAGLRLSVLLALRFTFAALFFGIWSRGEKALPVRVRLSLFGVGGVFLLNSFAYFKALETLSAAETALLLYIYPVLVTLFSAALGIEPLTVRGLGAALLSFTGAALTISPGESKGELGGILYALLAAVLYASFIVLASRFASGVPAQASARHIAQLGAVVYLGLAFLQEKRWELPTSPSAWGSVFGIGFFCTVVAHACFLAGLPRIGPGRASVVSSFEVVVTVLLALVFLGERVGVRPILGGSLIVGAVFLQGLKKRRPNGRD